MQTGISGELRVEGTHQNAAMFSDHPMAGIGRQGGDPRARSRDRGGADKDGVHRRVKAGNTQVYLGAIDLPAEGIAARINIDEAKGGLQAWRAVSQRGGLASENGPGTGAINAHAVSHGSLDCLGETPTVGKFSDGGGFATGQNQAMQAGEVFWLAHLHPGYPEVGKDAEVFRHGALEGEDTDGGFGGSRHWDSLRVGNGWDLVDLRLVCRWVGGGMDTRLGRPAAHC